MAFLQEPSGAILLGRKVKDDDKGHARLDRHLFEKTLERSDTPRRPSESDQRQHLIAMGRNDIVHLFRLVLLDEVR
jgi:hypothetical protein